MKLLYYEFRKLSYQKIFLFFFAVLLIFNVFFMEREIDDNKIQNERELTAFMEEYKRDPEGTEAYMARYQALLSARREDPTLPMPENVYSSNDRGLFSSFRDIQRLDEDYAELLAKAQKVASGKLLEYDYFGYPENSFEVVYQRAVLSSYGALEDLRFPLENLVGYDLFFGYNGFCVFLLLGVALLGIQLVTEEDSAGMTMILRASKRGRQPTMLSKLGVGACMTALLCVLFAGSTLFLLWRKSGLCGWAFPIQMIEDLAFCPYRITVGEGILLSLVIQFVTAFAFLMLVMCLAVLLKQTILIFASVVALIGVNYAIANHTFFDGYSFFKNINLFWCLDGTRLLSRYSGVRLFDRCFGAIPTWLMLYLSLMLLGGVGAVLLFANGKVTRALSVKKVLRLQLPLKKRLRYPRGLYRFEMKKLLSRVALPTIAVFLVLTLWMSESTYHVKRNFDANFYAEYMNELEGPYTEEKHRRIETDYMENSKILSRKEQMKEAFENGEITLAVYNSFLYDALTAETRQTVLHRLYTRSSELKAYHEAGLSAAYFDDMGWEMMRKTNIAWISCLSVVVLSADVFAREYRSGFRSILCATKRGRRKTALMKLLSVVTMALFVGLLSDGCELIFAEMYAELRGASYSARSMGLDTGLPVWGYFALMTMKKLGILSLLAVLTATLSRLTKRLIPTLVVMTLVITAPLILNYFGITILDDLSILNLFRR